MKYFMANKLLILILAFALISMMPISLAETIDYGNGTILVIDDHISTSNITIKTPKDCNGIWNGITCFLFGDETEAYSKVTLDGKIYDKTTIFTNLTYNSADLTFGEAIFEVNSPVELNKDNIRFDFNEVKNKIIGYEIWVNYTNYSDVVTYKNVLVKQDCLAVNGSEFIKDGCSYNTSVIDKTTRVYFEDWKLLGENNFKQNKIKIIGHWKAGEVLIDWIPTISIDAATLKIDKSLVLTKDDWAWWSNDWDFKRQINITDNSGKNLANRTIEIILSNVSYGNWSSIRFVNSSESGEYGYYYEPYNATANKFYVRIVENMTANSNTTIYMYYGNDAVTTTSNIKNAFVVGDDFEDGSLDSGIWTSQGATEASGSVLIAGGIAANRIESKYNFVPQSDYKIDVELGDVNDNANFFNYVGIMHDAEIQTGTFNYWLATAANGILWRSDRGSSGWTTPTLVGVASANTTFIGNSTGYNKSVYFSGAGREDIRTGATGSVAEPFQVACDSTNCNQIYVYKVKGAIYPYPESSVYIGSEMAPVIFDIDQSLPLVDWIRPPTPINGTYNISLVQLAINGSGFNFEYLEIGISTDPDFAPLPFYESTNTSYIAPLYWNWTAPFDGTFYIKGVSVNTMYNLYNFTDILNITIDTITPEIEFVTPTYPNGAQTNRSYILVNTTLTDSNPFNVTTYLYNLTAKVAEASLQTSNLDIVFSGLPSGNYSFYSMGCDVVNHCNITGNRSVWIDLEAPGYNITYPYNNSILLADVVGTITVHYVTANFTINLSDATGIANATLNIYNETDLYYTNSSGFLGWLNGVFGFVVQLVDGTYNWAWTIEDVVNNTVTTPNSNVSADTNLVKFVNPTPIDDASYSNVTQTFNVTITNVGGATPAFCNLNMFRMVDNISTSYPMSIVGQSAIVTINLIESTYNYTVNCTDSNGISSTSYKRDVIIFPSTLEFSILSPSGTLGPIYPPYNYTLTLRANVTHSHYPLASCYWTSSFTAINNVFACPAVGTPYSTTVNINQSTLNGNSDYQVVTFYFQDDQGYLVSKSSKIDVNLDRSWKANDPSGITRAVMWMLLGIIGLVGLAGSAQYFIVKIGGATSYGEWWKSLMMWIIWTLLYLIMWVMISYYIMNGFYPVNGVGSSAPGGGIR